MVKISNSLSLARFAKAIGYASSGIKYAFLNEPAFFRAIIVEAFAGVFLAWYLWPFTALEAALVVIAAALVPITEIINTSIEILVDMVQPAHDIRVKHIKDCAAGATMLSSSTALIIIALVVLAH